MPIKCKSHAERQREKNPRPDDRPSAAKRGYDRRWRKLRKMFLAANPLCVDCLTRGETVPATQVHHKQPIRTHPHLQYDWSNLESLCDSCHSRRTAQGLLGGNGQ